MTRLAWLVVVGACANTPSAGPPTDEPREHHQRFHGLWAVTQPYHAAYEQTLYWFHPDGQLGLGPSFPSDCSGHLSRHCVTGSVANCKPALPSESCTSELTCVFGDEWYSTSSSSLVIAGDCSDGLDRPIAFEMNPDSSGNADLGANAVLQSVAGETNWSHDNWEWAFQKCPDGNVDTCPFGSPL